MPPPCYVGGAWVPQWPQELCAGCVAAPLVSHFGNCWIMALVLMAAAQGCLLAWGPRQEICQWFIPNLILLGASQYQKPMGLHTFSPGAYTVVIQHWLGKSRGRVRWIEPETWVWLQGSLWHSSKYGVAVLQVAGTLHCRSGGHSFISQQNKLK